MMTTEVSIDQAKLQSFAMRAIGDVGALMSSALVVIGDRLNLYRAMAGSEPLTPAELAARTGTVERYVREWLVNQAAGGYVDYDAAIERYSLPAEHAVVRRGNKLAGRASPQARNSAAVARRWL